ncbi:carbohydrate-binding protein [Nonomuraea sp. NPDC051191]|uniref:carbohydrate-binding protein n=1 Tax=Nonomuraea sp. NPDC051191 TaxID=3364372 RepID=UPI0037B80534
MRGGNLSRRQLGTLVGAALLAPAAARPATTTSGVAWKLMWAPEASTGGLDAFETIEDDRAGSHPAGQPHIFPEGNNFRFTMHTVDRDTMTDRQRQEVTGTRTPTGYLRRLLGETWRVTCSMYIPSSLKASTTFTHISQTKRPGTGTLPITVTSIRRVDGAQTIEHEIIEGDVLVGRAPLNPLHDTWIDAEYEIRIGEGSAGSVRWALRRAGTTLIDATRTGDTYLGDRVRPKWGIYRSLGDTSGSLQECYLLLTNMRAYKQVAATATRLEAANGTTADRPMDVSVNGTLVASAVSFPGTGSWTAWASKSIAADLVAGANTIRLTATAAGGCPNLDYLEVLQ